MNEKIYDGRSNSESCTIDKSLGWGWDHIPNSIFLFSRIVVCLYGNQNNNNNIATKLSSMLANEEIITKIKTKIIHRNNQLDAINSLLSTV